MAYDCPRCEDRPWAASDGEHREMKEHKSHHRFDHTGIVAYCSCGEWQRKVKTVNAVFRSWRENHMRGRTGYVMTAADQAAIRKHFKTQGLSEVIATNPYGFGRRTL